MRKGLIHMFPSYAVALLAMVGVFLLLTMTFASMGRVYETDFKTQLARISSIDAAHLFEDCIGDKNGIIPASFLDRLNGNDVEDIFEDECGKEPDLTIVGKVSMVDGQTWSFGYDRDDTEFREATIFTNILYEGEVHVGKITIQAKE